MLRVPRLVKTSSSESLNKYFLINEFMTEMVHLSETQLFPLMDSSEGFLFSSSTEIDPNHSP